MNLRESHGRDLVKLKDSLLVGTAFLLFLFRVSLCLIRLHRFIFLLVDGVRFLADAVAEVGVDDHVDDGAHDVGHDYVEDGSDTDSRYDHRHHEHGHAVVHHRAFPIFQRVRSIRIPKEARDGSDADARMAQRYGLSLTKLEEADKDGHLDASSNKATQVSVKQYNRSDQQTDQFNLLQGPHVLVLACALLTCLPASVKAVSIDFACGTVHWMHGERTLHRDECQKKELVEQLLNHVIIEY